MSEDRPRVSIVLAVRNGARTLEACLDSIAGQTLEGIELVVQDGASTDGTRAILERRASELASCVSERDGGIYDAWNRALRRCRGEWICFIGADDVFAHPTSLARMLEADTGDAPPNLICALAALQDEHGEFLRVIGRPWSWAAVKQHQVVAHPGMLHRAELFERFGEFDTSFAIAGDYDFLLRAGGAVRAAFVDQVSVRLGGGGVSRKRARTTYMESWRAQARHPEIGMAPATRSLGVAFTKYAIRTLLRRP